MAIKRSGVPVVDNKSSSKSGSKGGNSGITTQKSDKINNWNDWFLSCGAILKDVQSYEELMGQYYDHQFSKKPEARERAQEAYQSRHDCGFYDKHRLVPKWKIVQGVIGFFAGILLGFIISLIVRVFTSKGVAPLDVVKDFGVLGTCAIIGLVSGLFICACIISIHILTVNKYKSGMRRLEATLKKKLAYIPPKFRNSQSIGAFYDLYCNYNVLTLDQAIPACEDYLQSNNLIGWYMAIMFDVPYENISQNIVDPFSSTSDGDRALANAPKSDDPNLPSDIRSKVFQGVDDAEARLNALVGLKQVKQQIRQMKNRISFYEGSNAERISGNHMVFLGPPGTGKTTIARIITKILYDFGYIKENRCIEIEGTYLKSPYVGQTAERATAILKYALGGVLFIDEAYALLDDKGGAGAEAISVLLKFMEDYKNDFVVIMAGYEDNVNRLLASNEGFSSRIKYKIYFEDFTVDEMMQIFEGLMKSSGNTYKMSDESKNTLRLHFEKEKRVPGFGNARVVRNCWDGLLDVHADRFMKGELKPEQKFVITKKDVDIWIEARREQMQADGRNFIASRNLDSTIVSLQELKGKTKPGSTDPDKDLENLTGLEIVKNEIRQMKAQFDFYNGNLDNEGYHMVFLGPPGTGKTTVASIMTGFLYQMGIIQTNSYLDINGDFLRGSYLGHTGKRTEAVVQYSQGMVLFVDEAYLLSSQEGSSDQFGQEAIGVLLDAMEKYRKNFVVIFAGYEYEMNKFLDMNSGLRSRISLELHFKSYEPKELAQMFRSVAKSKGFKVDKDVWVPLQMYFKEQRQDPKFGNGRFVRQFFEEVKKAHIVNYSNKMYNDSLKYVIMLPDVEFVISRNNDFDMNAGY